MWHTVLAALRLPPTSLAFKYTALVLHILQTMVTVLVFIAAASPRSEALTRATRVLVYITLMRADVDVGPAAWHVAFIGLCIWAVVLAAITAWMSRTGRSLVR